MSEEPNKDETMEVDAGDEANKSVMALSGVAGSISLSLHPLVIMNISEHWTRIRAQEGAAQQGCHIIN
jgi:COP9 signalosome complex subunit 6